jgi:hypothetical protein
LLPFAISSPYWTLALAAAFFGLLWVLRWRGKAENKRRSEAAEELREEYERGYGHGKAASERHVEEKARQRLSRAEDTPSRSPNGHNGADS